MWEYEICKASSSRASNIRSWKDDYFEKVVLSETSELFESKVLYLIKDALELSHSSVSFEVLEHVSKSSADEDFLFISAVSEEIIQSETLKNLRMMALAICQEISVGQNDWVEDINTQGNHYPIDRSCIKDEASKALMKKFKKKYGAKKLPSVSLKFDDNTNIRISSIKPCEKEASENDKIALPQAELKGWNWEKQLVLLESAEIGKFELDAKKDNQTSNLLLRLYQKVMLKDLTLSVAISPDNGKKEYAILSGELVLPNGETAKL